MRVDSRLKLIFYSSFIVLYFSGVINFGLQLARTPADGPGLTETWALHLHGMIGLWFLVLFGLFYHAHIRPSLKGFRQRRSGLSGTIVMGALCASVPFLYYLSDESWRDVAVRIHTYLGCFAVVPIAYHVVQAIRSRRTKRPVFRGRLEKKI